MLNEVIDRNTYVAAAIIVAGVSLITVGKGKATSAQAKLSEDSA